MNHAVGIIIATKQIVGHFIVCLAYTLMDLKWTLKAAQFLLLQTVFITVLMIGNISGDLLLLHITSVICPRPINKFISFIALPLMSSIPLQLLIADASAAAPGVLDVCRRWRFPC